LIGSPDCAEAGPVNRTPASNAKAGVQAAASLIPANLP
jgi:hypothetical protein